MKQVTGKLPKYSQNTTTPQKTIHGCPIIILTTELWKTQNKTMNTEIMNKWAKAVAMATGTFDFQMLGNQLY